MLNYSKSLMALGIGAYFEGGIGESKLKTYYTDQRTLYAYDKYFHGINYLYGCGLLLDTCGADDKLFNYRFQFGCEGYTYPKAPSWDWPQYNYTPQLTHMHSFRLNMKNTFGFRVFRNKLLRLWVGLRITSYYPYYHTYQGHLRYDQTAKLGYIFPGLFVPGLVIGLNLNLNEMISLAAEIGVNYEWSVPKDEDIFSANCHFTLGILFRIKTKSHKTNIRLQEIIQPENNLE
jgi:hypothetical protein